MKNEQYCGWKIDWGFGWVTAACQSEKINGAIPLPPSGPFFLEKGNKLSFRIICLKLVWYSACLSFCLIYRGVMKVCGSRIWGDSSRGFTWFGIQPATYAELTSRRRYWSFLLSLVVKVLWLCKNSLLRFFVTYDPWGPLSPKVVKLQNPQSQLPIFQLLL